MTAVRSLIFVLAGCGGTDAVKELPAPSYEMFAEVANSILVERCGSSACHGNDARGLVLYAPRQRRAPPMATFSPEPLTELEVRANYDSTLGFVEGPTALETQLILKSLGGRGHAPGPVFEHRSDPECRALRAWIETAP